MQRSGLKRGLLFTTSMMTATLGYGRKAYAVCSPNPFVTGAYTCTGVNGSPNQYSFTGTNLSIVVASPTLFFNNSGTLDQIAITGDGNQTFESQGSVILFSHGGSGVDIYNTGIGQPGSINVTTSYQAPSGPNVWRIEGETAGIEATNAANGNITMDLDSRIIGVNAGVVAEQFGDGNIAIVVGDAGTNDNEGSILATGTATDNHGLLTYQGGNGSTTLTLNADITATGGDAVRALGGEFSTGITVNLGDGDLSGGRNGLAVNQDGLVGGVTIQATSPLAPGSITGQLGDGILVENDGASGITIVTGAGAVTGGAAGGNQSQSGIDATDTGVGGISITTNGSFVTGDASGISATNQGGGAVSVTTGSGAVTGVFGSAVSVQNDSAGTSANVTTGSGTLYGFLKGIYVSNDGTSTTISTGTGSVTGGIFGIDAQHSGSGLLTIQTGGYVAGIDSHAINADNDGGLGIVITTGSGNVVGQDPTASGINVTNNSGLVTVTTGGGLVYGGDIGIEIANSGDGLVTVNTGTGGVSGNRGDGVFISNTGNGGVTVGTGSGEVSGGANGIDVTDTGSGGITITTGGDVSGNSTAVVAQNLGGGSVSVTTQGGAIFSLYESGIVATNAGGTGSVTVTTGAGPITAYGNDAIFTSNSGGGGVTVTTGSGAINGGLLFGTGSGIEAVDTGAGGITITVNDSDVTGAAEGVLATNTGGGSVVITTNAGDILGTNDRGIEATNDAAGTSLAITTGGGSVTSNTDDGIFAQNAGTGGITITTGTGAISGGSAAGEQAGTSGIEALDTGAGGVTITVNDGDVTGDSAGINVGDTGNGSVSITTNGGDILGRYGSGITASNTGDGSVTITTGEGAITGNLSFGIVASNSGTGGIVVTTGSGAVTGGAASGVQSASGISLTDTGAGGVTLTVNDSSVTGDTAGVRVSNDSGGSVDVTTNDGAILGLFGRGIFVENTGGTGSVTITTGEGSVTGVADDGIAAINTGDGGIMITTGTGAVAGGSDVGNNSASGIQARDDGLGGIDITTGVGTVTGDSEGILAENTGGGSVEITTAGGNILGVFGRGIEATNTFGTGGITITTGSGTVTGNTEDGISATNSGSAGIEITTGTGDITGGAAAGISGNAYGIRAVDNGTGPVTITVNDSNVTGDGNGVFVQNYGTGGDTTITTNDGNIRGSLIAGIAASNGSGSGAMTIATNTGTVYGGNYGILATNNGTGELTITTGDGDVTGNNLDGIRAFGAATSTGVSITLEGAADVTGGRNGVRGEAAGGGLTIDASASTGTITGETGNGIDAWTQSSATGDLVVTTGAGSLGVAVVGQLSGIYAANRGDGLLSITTGAGSVTGTTQEGIYASNAGGLGVDIQTGSGLVQGGDRGIEVQNDTGFVTIDTYDGDVTGNSIGILVENTGSGDVTITTRESAITGTTGRGIEVYDYSTGNVTITTGAGNADGLAVFGGFAGIYAENLNGGALDITIGDGDIIGATGFGIVAANSSGATDLSITLTGAADVTGRVVGISASNYGIGGTVIDASAATGVIEGELGPGIYASNGSATTGGITITTGAGDGTDAVLAGVTGIDARNRGAGSVSITTADGAITGTIGDGIRASNSSLGEDLTITTAAGAIDGGRNGIAAFQRGVGLLSITTGDGAVSGTNADGIYAYNFGGVGTDIDTGFGDISGGDNGIEVQNDTGFVAIDTFAGDVTGGNNGIRVENTGDGSVTITARDSAIIGEAGSGIRVDDLSEGSVSITIGAGDATGLAVQGATNGIAVTNEGQGDITITVGDGDIIGDAQDGIFAENTDSDSGALNIILQAAGNVTGGGNGISLRNYGAGTTVDGGAHTGTITGRDGDGINAYNGSGSTGGILVNTGAGSGLVAVVGSEDGIDLSNEGADSITINTGTGTVTGSGGDGIQADQGYAGTSIMVTTGTGAVQGSLDGIDLDNQGTGEISITTNGTVTGLGGDGIHLSNGAYYDGGVQGTNVTITANAAVEGRGGDGIDATNIGSGSLTITTNDVVDGGKGAGILASNGYAGYYVYGTDLAINANDAVTGSTDGIVATNVGRGSLEITTAADAVVTGQGGDGIRASNGTVGSFYVYGTDLTITANAAVEGRGGDGIQATNLGTGALTITANEVVEGSGGDGIRAANGSRAYWIYGTDLVITANDAVTGSASGIYATNAGTGRLEITTEADVTGRGSYGIYASNGTFYDSGFYGTSLTITTNGNVFGQGGDGIKAKNTGDGALTITTNGVVDGDAGAGIAAYNGGINGNTFSGTDLTIDAGDDVTGSTYGIFAFTYGSGATSITVAGDVTGSTAAGIDAYSSAYGTSLSIETGLTTQVTGGTNGIRAANLGTGDLTVAVYGRGVTGNNGSGITSYQRQGQTTITIASTAVVEGTADGINAGTAGGAPVLIDNNGILRNASMSRSDVVVRSSGGATTLANDGTMTGRVLLGAFDDVLTNNFTWVTGGTSDFGAGDDAVTNNDLLIAANQAGAAETVVFANLELLTNSGTIDLSDDISRGGSTAFDTLEIAGDFEGVNGTLMLDAYLGGAGSQADTLVISGTATGTTGITLLNTNAGSGGTNANILLVDTGGSTGTEFFLTSGAIRVGSYIYDLFWDGEDFFLQSSLDVLQLDSAVLPAVLGDLWQITATGWHQNTLRLQGSAGGGAVGASRLASDPTAAMTKGTGALGWGTLILDRRESDGTVIADSAGTPTPVDISFDQSTRAFVGGLDLISAPDGNGGILSFGALLGVVDSSVDFATTGNRADFEGPTYGIHVAYSTDAFRADLILKRDDLNLEYTVGSLSNEPGLADATSTGASLEFGYKLHETSTMAIEAVANLSHVSTRIDSFAIAGSAFDFDRSDSTRGALGLAFRGTYAMGALNVQPNATLKYWSIFDGGHTSAIDAVAFSYDGTGSYVEASAGLEFTNPDSALSGFISGSGFVGGERTGVRAQMGLNFQW